MAANAQGAQVALQWTQMMGRIGVNAGTVVELGLNGILGLITLLVEFTKEELNNTLSHMSKYPYPNRPPGAVVYVLALSRQGIFAAREWCRMQMRLGLVVPVPEELTVEEIVGAKMRIQELLAFKVSVVSGL